MWKNKVDIVNCGSGKGIICLTKYINSNAINALVEIHIFDKCIRRVAITPTLINLKEMKLLDASKSWLKGMTKGEYYESKDLISGDYEWGGFSAEYRKDRDYGIAGGDIIFYYGL